MMTNKSIQRQRRARRGRSKVRSLEINRLTVYRSNKHIYAQIMDSKGSEVLASASTNETEVKQQNNGNIEAASKVGKLIAERAKTKGIESVAFDRSGYKYHGRVKALAEAAREEGLNF
jgi:large subunit ribosomal protein L18|tara:strand:+ start:375 stop:728 length:354 start_codon:yes stop_codon:yes gene_type:complete